mmetsp:Transcript_17004/g.28228  ORF Transcript_17004/g.28228 Transcript_17004/m.28228 type:complete len:216 (-) Transcript_17004:62-709(-)
MIKSLVHGKLINLILCPGIGIGIVMRALMPQRFRYTVKEDTHSNPSRKKHGEVRHVAEFGLAVLVSQTNVTVTKGNVHDEKEKHGPGANVEPRKVKSRPGTPFQQFIQGARGVSHAPTREAPKNSHTNEGSDMVELKRSHATQVDLGLAHWGVSFKGFKIDRSVASRLSHLVFHTFITILRIEALRRHLPLHFWRGCDLNVTIRIDGSGLFWFHG